MKIKKIEVLGSHHHALLKLAEGILPLAKRELTEKEYNQFEDILIKGKTLDQTARDAKSNPAIIRQQFYKMLQKILKKISVLCDLEDSFSISTEEVAVPSLEGIKSSVPASSPVAILNPSAGLEHILRSSGNKSINNLLKTSVEDLLKYRSFGQTKLKELRIKLAEVGYHLKDDAEFLISYIYKNRQKSK